MRRRRRCVSAVRLRDLPSWRGKARDFDVQVRALVAVSVAGLSSAPIVHADNVTATVPVGAGPTEVAVAPTAPVYVTDYFDAAVTVVDTATDTVTATVPVGGYPTDVAIGPDGSRAYVTNSDDGTVSVLDTAAGTVVATVPVGAGPEGVAVTPDGARAFVSNYDGGTVSVIDTRTDAVTATVPVGRLPSEVAITPTASACTSPNRAATRWR